MQHVDSSQVPALEYRPDSLFALFQDSASATGAARALQAAGFVQSNVQVVHGKPDHDVQPEGVLAHLTDGYDELRQYAAWLEEGHTVVAVRVPDRDAAYRAAELIYANGGHEVNYYSNWQVETIPEGHKDPGPIPVTPPS